MHNNSSLTMYDDASVAYLYLYENTEASFYSFSGPMELYIDPAQTNNSLVTLYATFDRFEPFGPNGRGYLYGNWLAGGSFNINLVSDGAYSKVQFIPDPASIVLLGLGAFAVFRKHRR